MDALLLMGHGSRDPEGVAELQRLVAAVREAQGGLVAAGVLEFDGPGSPSLQAAFDACVAQGATRVVGQPLLLLCGDHDRADMPAQAEMARRRHPGLQVDLGEHLGLHDLLLEVVGDRAAEALDDGEPHRDTALLLCARGSYRAEANADFCKLARLAWERFGERYPWVEACFISLARPSVAEGIRRCAALGARRVVVAPYFLNTGVLVKRIAEQAEATTAELAGVAVVVAEHLGVDPRVVRLILQRAAEVGSGAAAQGYCCPLRARCGA